MILCPLLLPVAEAANVGVKVLAAVIDVDVTRYAVPEDRLAQGKQCRVRRRIVRDHPSHIDARAGVDKGGEGQAVAAVAAVLRLADDVDRVAVGDPVVVGLHIVVQAVHKYAAPVVKGLVPVPGQRDGRHRQGLGVPPKRVVGGDTVGQLRPLLLYDQLGHLIALFYRQAGVVEVGVVKDIADRIGDRCRAFAPFSPLVHHAGQIPLLEVGVFAEEDVIRYLHIRVLRLGDGNILFVGLRLGFSGR